MAKVRVNTPIAGKYSVLVKVDESDTGRFVDIVATQNGSEIYSERITVGNTINYDNNDSSSTVAEHAVFSIESPGTPVLVEATSPGSATVYDVVCVPPDPRFGISPISRDAAHCYPVALKKDGKLLHVITGLGDGKRYLSYDGEPLGEIFSDVPASDRQTNDTYHQCSAISYVDGNYVVIMTDHNQVIYMIKSVTPKGLTSASSIAITSSSDQSTYLNVVGQSEFGGKLWITTRIGNSLYLIEVGDINSSPTVTIDVLTTLSGKRPYPRGLTLVSQDDASPLLVIGYQTRVSGGTERWEKIGAIVYDPSDRQVYTTSGETSGSTSLGTSGSPKLNQAAIESGSHSTAGSMIFLDVNASGTRYGSFIHPKVETWNATTKRIDCLFVWADSNSITDSTATGLTVRVCYYLGDGSNTRLLSSNTDNVFNLDGFGSYRIDSLIQWAPSSTDIAEIYLGVAQSSPNDQDDYYDFGPSHTFTRFEVDTTSLTSSSELLAAITEEEKIYFTSQDRGDIKGIEGSSDFIIRGEGFSMMDQTRSQGLLYYYGENETVDTEELDVENRILYLTSDEITSGSTVIYLDSDINIDLSIRDNHYLSKNNLEILLTDSNPKTEYIFYVNNLYYKVRLTTDDITTGQQKQGSSVIYTSPSTFKIIENEDGELAKDGGLYNNRFRD